MSEFEQDPIEVELHKVTPAKLPDPLLNRLHDLRPVQPAESTPSPWPARLNSWRTLLLRWLVPVGALAVLSLIVVRFAANRDVASNRLKPQLTPSPAILADKVQLNNELAAYFDVVAVLPGGEPVRFRCRQWNDELIITDKRGLEIQQDQRRIEVIPVKFETY